MKTYFTTKVIDLWFQLGYMTPKKNRFFKKPDENTIDTNLYATLKNIEKLKWLMMELKKLQLNLYK